MFAVGTEMNENPFNFGYKTQCEEGCPEAQDNPHILNCRKSYQNTTIVKYKDILNGSLSLKIQTFRKFQQQLIARKHLLDSV